MDLSDMSFDLSNKAVWHPLQKASSEDDDEASGDDDDDIHIAKLPSLQAAAPKYEIGGLTRKLAIDLKVTEHFQFKVYGGFFVALGATFVAAHLFGCTDITVAKRDRSSDLRRVLLTTDVAT